MAYYHVAKVNVKLYSDIPKCEILNPSPQTLSECLKLIQKPEAPYRRIINNHSIKYYNSDILMSYFPNHKLSKILKGYLNIIRHKINITLYFLLISTKNLQTQILSEYFDTLPHSLPDDLSELRINIAYHLKRYCETHKKIDCINCKILNTIQKYAPIVGFLGFLQLWLMLHTK